MNKIKILIAEHDHSDIDIMHHELIKAGLNYESEVVQNESGFRKALVSFNPDIILSDYSFPAFDGATAFKIKEDLTPETPFIFVSGIVGEEIAVELIKNGLTDYALKDKLFALPEKIKRALGDTKKKHEKAISDENLSKANQLYAFISQVNKNIVRVIDEETLFRNSCELAVDYGKFKIAWIGIFDPGNTSITLIEQCGIDPEVQAFDSPAYLPQDGAQMQVINSGSYFISNDISKDTKLAHWKQYTKPYNINSCMVFPIRRSGEIIGTFNLYSTELNYAGHEQISLLEEVTNDISFALDIFEKERIHRSLEEAQDFDKSNLDALINTTEDLMWSVDRDFRLVTSNNAFNKFIVRISGREILKGDSVFSSNFPHEAHLKYKTFYQRAFTGESFCAIDRITEPVEHWSETSFYPMRKGNEVIGTACFSHDITKQKNAEEEREKMVANIVQHSKNLEQFAFIVSHNMRAPVASIMGLANVLKNTISEDDKARTQEFLFSSIAQLDEVFRDINKILQVRPEIKNYNEVIVLDELVGVIKTMILGIPDQENVKIITDFDAINKISSIKSYMHSIFYNLISNSIKYRRPGTIPTIKITSKVDNEMIIISFKDNGLGIDLSKHGDKLFGLYKRFHHHIEGKGMGLFMVKTQLESLGGTIAVKSEEDMWTEFVIELPFS